MSIIFELVSPYLSTFAMLTVCINVSYLPAGAILVVPVDFEWEMKHVHLPAFSAGLVRLPTIMSKCVDMANCI